MAHGIKGKPKLIQLFFFSFLFSFLLADALCHARHTQTWREEMEEEEEEDEETGGGYIED